MDPCPFVRVLVGNLALRLPVASRPTKTAVHPSAAPCYCKIRLNKDPSKSAAVPLDSGGGPADPPSAPLPLAAAFSTQIAGKSSSSIFATRCRIKIQIYTGRRGSTCGVTAGRLLGEVALPVDLKGAGGRPCVFYNGWIDVGKKGTKAKLHLTVRSEPDPRFVFEFGGEPECSPQVFQVQGSMKQPVFTCKFSCRNAGDRNGGIRSRSSSSESIGSRSWLTSAFGSDRERPGKERKGWSITVHDLSGSPVALASMVTPFVASPGADRVSRSNPGAWLILRPGDGTWKPWARLEAWRERGPRDSLGYRFSLLPDTHISSGVSLAESTIAAGKGGSFAIDLTSNVLGRSPGCSPRGSGDFGYGMWPFAGGLVMSSTVGGEGKSSRPIVEVGVQHVGCSEDAAAYVALAAAVDLSMDACRLFSQKLRRELCQQQEDYCG